MSDGHAGEFISLDSIANNWSELFMIIFSFVQVVVSTMDSNEKLV